MNVFNLHSDFGATHRGLDTIRSKYQQTPANLLTLYVNMVTPLARIPAPAHQLTVDNIKIVLSYFKPSGLIFTSVKDYRILYNNTSSLDHRQVISHFLSLSIVVTLFLGLVIFFCCLPQTIFMAFILRYSGILS